MIVDPKVVALFNETHVAQMIGYQNITGLDLALLINFKNARLEWKRVLRPQQSEEYCHLICVPESAHPCNPCNPWSKFPGDLTRRQELAVRVSLVASLFNWSRT